jgi:glycolate oxidase
VRDGLPQDLFRALHEVFGDERLVTAFEERILYEADGHTLATRVPDAVVYPESTAEVRAAMLACERFGVPYLARGAGTGLSGGAVAAQGGVIVETARMNRILSIDYDNRTAVVQPGLVNLHLSLKTRPHGLHYAPDPSSQGACTIGGNVAENSGGPHTLKYGVTTNHVLGLEVVLPTGEVLRTGDVAGLGPGYDLTGLIVGSEGTFGIVTEVTVRLMPNAESVRTFLAVYDSIEDASETVSAVIRHGIVPAAIELIDRLAIRAVEAHLKVGFPEDAAAVLLIEIDGDADELEGPGRKILELCRAHRCRSVEPASDEATRQRFWKGRKLALGALGKLSPAYYTHDGVVPRSRLPEALRNTVEIAGRHGLRVAHVCHAGDGNIHPLLLFDPRDPDEVERTQRAGEEILRMCVDLGGVLTGEHGVGQEKQSCMPWLFDEHDLDQMQRVRSALNPTDLCNPSKVFPTGAKCGEIVAARAGKTGGWV